MQILFPADSIHSSTGTRMVHSIRILFFLSGVLLFVLPRVLWCETIVLTSGDMIKGSIVSQDPWFVRVVTEAGVRVIEKRTIRRIGYRDQRRPDTAATEGNDKIREQQKQEAQRRKEAERRLAIKRQQDRMAREAAAKAEQDRAAQEAATKAEQDRAAQEAATKAEQDRAAQEAATKAEQDRIARESATKAEQDRAAQEAATKAEQDRAARDSATKAEQDRAARDSATKAEQDRAAQEAATKAEQDRAARESATKAEQDRAAQEAATKAEQDRAAQEAATKAEQDRAAQDKTSQVSNPTYLSRQAILDSAHFPGSGQWRNGRKYTGYGFFGSVSIGALVTLGYYRSYRLAVDDYNRQILPAEVAAFSLPERQGAVRERAQAFHTAGWITVLLYLWNVADAGLFSRAGGTRVQAQIDIQPSCSIVPITHMPSPVAHPDAFALVATYRF